MLFIYIFIWPQQSGNVTIQKVRIQIILEVYYLPLSVPLMY